MRVILNSDVICSADLRQRLPEHIVTFLKECIASGALLVLPLTTILEYEHRQTILADQRHKELQHAAELLQRHGITVDAVNLQDRVQAPRLQDMLSQEEIPHEVVQPTYGDFADAHRRACLHLAPHPPARFASKKGDRKELEEHSDEMRDLVIWAVAVRIASAHGGALLVSRDEIHASELGEAEASTVKLVRVKSPEDALDFLGRETPAAQKARQLLGPHWEGLLARVASLGDFASVRIREARFVRGGANVGRAQFRLLADARGARRSFDVEARLLSDSDASIRVAEADAQEAREGAVVHVTVPAESIERELRPPAVGGVVHVWNALGVPR